MGQGVYTSMPMLIAEELNVDIQKVQVPFAPPGKVYGNALIFGLQLTGGSTSVREGWEKLRVAGAQVREMLVTAAALKSGVPFGDLRAENGFVFGPSGKKARRQEGKLRRTGRLGLQGGAARGAAHQGSGELPHRRQAHDAPRYAGQGQRHGAVRCRCAAAGHGDCHARPVPRHRRQGQELRRQRRQGHAWRDRSGPRSGPMRRRPRWPSSPASSPRTCACSPRSWAAASGGASISTSSFRLRRSARR